MFQPTDVEVWAMNKRRPLPKPGRVHGGGGKIKGKKDDKYVDVRNSVNKLNPYIRGTGNIVLGRFIDKHDTDDEVRISAKQANNATWGGVAYTPSGRNRPLRCRVK